MKHYIDIHIPTTNCNLNCTYCYVGRTGQRDTKPTYFRYNTDKIVAALTTKRLGGICLFNLCALGETLIPKETIEITKGLLKEGHFVMVVTNGLLTARIQELLDVDETMRERLMFKLSFHYLELVEKDLLDEFVENVYRIKTAKCSYTIEITPSDELEEYIEEIKEFSIKKFGALPHVTIPRNENDREYALQSRHTFDEFCKIWSVFESELFNFKKSIWGIKRKEYCYAGQFSGLLDLRTGYLKSCYNCISAQNILEDGKKTIKFIPVGRDCRMPHCYNGHSFLGFGDIPEIECSYSLMRNRVCIDGTEWLQPKMKLFLDEKLYDSNIYAHSKKTKSLLAIRKKKMEIEYLLKRGFEKMIERMRGYE
jgi:MoaA/NifB/PqqE/SkfB family radical SAM enzyme